jgi:hypothetical protein
VSEGDILQVELDAAPTSKVTVEVVVSYADITETKTLPEDLGGNARYLWLLNNTDTRGANGPTVSCIDLDTEQEIAVIDMPSDYSSGSLDISMFYRFQSKEVYLFYNTGNALVINGNPKSSDFNQSSVFNYGSFVNINTARSIVFVQTLDIFHHQSSKQYSAFKNDGTVLRGKPSAGVITCDLLTNSFILGNRIYGDRAGTLVLEEEGGTFRFIDMSFAPDGKPRGQDVVYNPNNGLLYQSAEGEIKIMDINGGTVSVIFAGGSAGSTDIDLKQNLALVGGPFNKNIEKIDCDTNTLLGSTDLNGEPDKIKFSPRTGLSYTKENGTNQVAILDASKPANDLRAKDVNGNPRSITVGASKSTRQNRNSAVLNQIVL